MLIIMKEGKMERILNRPLMVDFHTHSNYSPDSNVTRVEMIEQAISIGITDLAFTDHVDLDADMDLAPQNWDFDRNDSELTLNALRNDYKGRINLYHGLEIGIQPHLAKENTEIVHSNRYDFVIASLHSVERRDLYHRKFFEMHSDKEAVRIYYKELYESLINYDAFSVIGHLDLYLRYKPELKNVRFEDYYDIVESIYKLAIESGKGIELNAGGHRYGIGHNNPHERLLKLYKDMNGEVISIGSDAHTTQYLGHQYSQNIEILKNIGFKYICTFENMKPIFHKL